MMSQHFFFFSRVDPGQFCNVQTRSGAKGREGLPNSLHLQRRVHTSPGLCWNTGSDSLGPGQPESPCFYQTPGLLWARDLRLKARAGSSGPYPPQHVRSAWGLKESCVGSTTHPPQQKKKKVLL